MNCAKCGKPMLDMRGTKTNAKAPDFLCPDAQCLNEKGFRSGAWLPKGRTPPVAPRVEAPRPVSGASSAPSPRDTLILELFWDSFDRVLAGLKERKLTDMFNGEQIAALTATCFIQRAKG